MQTAANLLMHVENLSLPAGLWGCPDSRAEPSQGTAKCSDANISAALEKREMPR